MIKCPNCGGELKFKPSDKEVVCEYCGSTFNPKELNKEAKDSTKVEKKDNLGNFEGNSYRCRECGAELLNFDETAITFCSYCGSQAMIADKMVKVNNPDYIIPFKITKEECIEAYKKAINKALFVPGYMKKDIVVDKFRGIYMPYCVYKVSYHDKAVNKGAKFTGRSGDYDFYDDYLISGQVDTEYDGISYDLLSKLLDKYTHHIPFNFKNAEDFNFNYMIGYYADMMDVKNNIYDGKAVKIVKNDTSRKMALNKTFSKYGCSDPHIDPSIESRKIGMFPLYFLAIRDKDKNYIHYAVVNGQTGKIAVDLPIDFGKYILGSLIVSIPIFLILDSTLLLLPKGIVIFSIISSIISCIIYTIQIGRMAETEKHFDDLGYDSVNKTTNQEKNLYRLSVKRNYKNVRTVQVISIIIAIGVLILNPVSDLYYYGVSIMLFIITILSFFSLVKQHNILASNKLPQLEKRGGEENE